MTTEGMTTEGGAVETMETAVKPKLVYNLTPEGRERIRAAAQRRKVVLKSAVQSELATEMAELAALGDELAGMREREREIAARIRELRSKLDKFLSGLPQLGD